MPKWKLWVKYLGGILPDCRAEFRRWRACPGLYPRTVSRARSGFRVDSGVWRAAPEGFMNWGGAA